MGLFHKTLKNAEEEIRRNNYEGAEKIIENHIHTDHSMDSVFNLLASAHHKYQEELRMLHSALSVRQQPHKNMLFANSLRSKALSHIKSAEDHLKEVEIRAKEIVKLSKE